MRWLRRLTWEQHFSLAVAVMVSAMVLHPLINPDNSLPAFLIVPLHPRASESVGEGRVELILVGRHPEATGGVRLDLVLVNGSNRLIRYHGYSPHSFLPPSLPGWISPLYLKEVERAGVWSRKRGWWCGNGATLRRLAPGRAARFEAYIRRDEPAVKIGVHYYDGAQADEGAGQIIWSEPIASEPSG